MRERFEEEELNQELQERNVLDMSLENDVKDNKRAHSSHNTASSVSSHRSVEHTQQGHKRRSLGDAAMLAEVAVVTVVPDLYRQMVR